MNHYQMTLKEHQQRTGGYVDPDRYKPGHRDFHPEMLCLTGDFHARGTRDAKAVTCPACLRLLKSASPILAAVSGFTAAWGKYREAILGRIVAEGGRDVQPADLDLLTPCVCGPMLRAVAEEAVRRGLLTADDVIAMAGEPTPGAVTQALPGWEVGTYGSSGFELQLPALTPEGLTRSVPLKNLTLTEAKVLGAAPELADALEDALDALTETLSLFSSLHNRGLMEARIAGHRETLRKAGRS